MTGAAVAATAHSNLPFDLGGFRQSLGRIREDVPLYELSALTGEGLPAWLDWLRALAA